MVGGVVKVHEEGWTGGQWGGSLGAPDWGWWWKWVSRGEARSLGCGARRGDWGGVVLGEALLLWYRPPGCECR